MYLENFPSCARGQEKGVVQLKSVVTRLCDVDYVLPRKGGNSPSVPGLEPRDLEGAVGGWGVQGRSWGVDCQAWFQLPPPPHPAHPPAAATTSCPAGGRELVLGGTDPGPGLGTPSLPPSVPGWGICPLPRAWPQAPWH